MARTLSQLNDFVLRLHLNPNRSDWSSQKQEVFSAYSRGDITAREMLQIIEDIDDRVVKSAMRGMSWTTKAFIKVANFCLSALGR